MEPDVRASSVAVAWQAAFSSKRVLKNMRPLLEIGEECGTIREPNCRAAGRGEISVGLGVPLAVAWPSEKGASSPDPYAQCDLYHCFRKISVLG